MTSLFQIEKDTLIWEEHCKQNISSLIGVHITNDQITRLDSLIQKSDFIHSKVVDVTSDTTLNQIQNIDFCMTEKYPAGSYLISAYDKNCLVQYQYLILGGDKMKSIFIFLKEQFPNDKQNEDINKILDSNLEIIQSCFE